MPKAMAALDPKVAIFMVGTLGIVALGGMALGYDIDLNVFGSRIKLSRPSCSEGVRRRLASAPYM